MGAVRAVLLDECLLCGEDENGDMHYLLPGAEILLRRLQYSKLHVAIYCHEVDKLTKVNFLSQVAMAYSLDNICVPCFSKVPVELLQAWNIPVGNFVLATSSRDKDFLDMICSEGWRVIVKGVLADLVENESLLFIEELEELLISLCWFIKKAQCDTSITVIGYVMKYSREEDFLKRGAFPMCPTESGLVFVPLTFGSFFSRQMQVIDAVLHKATDEIVTIHASTTLDFPKGITYSRGVQELERYIHSHPQCCMIDPLCNVDPLLDRLRIHQILVELSNLNTKSGCRIRAPYSLKIDDFVDPTLKEKLLFANLSFPNIVKPQVACGLANAHKMALVFKYEDFEDLHIPLPAIVQEYVDHGSIIFKFYVLGEKVFYAVKKSMPNADFFVSTSSENGCSPVVFDSLKSLPTAEGTLDAFMEQRHYLDIESIKDAANWLRGRLDLTIFGFDIVIQEDTGDHIIVDVNYLPSFKEIPDGDAIPAFWDAIRCTYETRKSRSN